MLQIKNTLGGGKPNAPYAWAKYEVIPDEILTNPSIDLSYVQSSGRINITGASFDLSFLPSVTNSNGLSLNGTDNEKQVVDFFTGFQIATNQYKLYLSNDVLTFYFEAGALSITGFHNYTDGIWFTVDVYGAYASFEKTLPFTGEKIARRSYHNLIEYITDKSPTKYPNGEVHTDGYFYRYAPEGLYAWKKNTLSFGEKSTASGQEVTHSSTATGTSVNAYYSTEYTFDTSTGIYTLVNPSVKTVPYGSQASISASNYAMFEASSGSVMYKATGSTLYLRNNSSGLSLIAESSSYNVSVYGSETVKTFIDYIVSDKETAYPDGGEKGGYWYENVSEGIPPKMFGCSKMAIDNFVFASNDEIGTLNHSLGEKPKFAFLIFNGENVTGGSSRVYVAIGSAYIDTDGTSIFHFEHQGNTAGSGYGDFKETKTTVTFSAPYFYYNVGEYTLITMA